MFVCKEGNVKFLHFEFVKRVTQTKRPLKKKQNELFNDTLGLKAAELEIVKDSFQEVEDCTAHAQMQSSQIWMPFSLHG